MKKLLTMLFFLLPFISNGQDTTYYNSEWEKIKSIKRATYYNVNELDKNNPNRLVVRSYSILGQIIKEVPYSDYIKEIKDGTQKEWYDNGQLKSSVDYKNGQFHGDVLTFYKDGKTKRVDYFEEGEFVKGKLFNSDGVKTLHFDFIVLPEFPGGTNKLMQYLVYNLVYPPFSLANRIEGKVVVRFCVGIDGRISKIKVVQSVYDDLDTEARRIVRKMPKWKPGLKDGEAADCWFSLPIIFKINNR